MKKMIKLGAAYLRHRRTMPHEEAWFSSALECYPEVRKLLEASGAAQGAPLVLMEMHMAMAAATWAESGFPTVSPGPRLAASLMATVIPRDHLSDVTLPWPGFAVDVPGGLAYADIPSEGGSTPRRVHVSSIIVFDRSWFSERLPDEARATGVKRNLTVAFVLGDKYGIFRVSDASDLLDVCASVTDGDAVPPYLASMYTILGRLVLGCCIELDGVKPERPSAGASRSARGRKGDEPTAWKFVLGRNVRSDCRDWVRGYLSGDRTNRVGVQTLVRGHHKRQPCGPGGVDRKWIHVEPYWRGPEDAPIPIRKHLLDGTSLVGGTHAD